jgi:broad specificity phosphatase PhoE
MLIVVRHGRTAANEAGLLQGRSDLPLDQRGIDQARAIATAVPHRTLVISSSLQRAHATGQMISTDVQIDDRWIEFDYGELDGTPALGVGAEIWDRWRGDIHFAPPRGESLADLDKRVREACEELAPIAAARDVVVVSHVSPIKAAVAWALGVGIDISWRCHLDVASICRITFTERGPLLRTFNETSHLRHLGPDAPIRHR